MSPFDHGPQWTENRDVAVDVTAELRKRELPGGGWSSGYLEWGGTEPACLAMLGAATHAAWKKGRSLQFLLAEQHRDGGWAAFTGDEDPSWATALAAITLGQVGPEMNARQRAVDWWVHTRSREGRWLWHWKFNLVDTQAQFDPDKYGWPWLPGASSWVIPTAFAVVALKQFVSCTPSEADGNGFGQASTCCSTAPA